MTAVIQDRRSFDRTRDAVFWAEAERAARGAAAPPEFVEAVWVKTTSGTATGGYYPGVVSLRKGDGTWEDQTVVVRVRGANDETLANNTRYGCRPSGLNASNEDTFTLLAAAVAAAASVSVVRITNSTLQADGYYQGTLANYSVVTKAWTEPGPDTIKILAPNAEALTGWRRLAYFVGVDPATSKNVWATHPIGFHLTFGVVPSTPPGFNVAKECANLLLSDAHFDYWNQQDGWAQVSISSTIASGGSGVAG
jgi:hypothetical protein